MAKELIISSNRHETKVALFEDEQLVEMYFQRADEYSLAGSIHKGRVTRVLPGMQSAFVNIGLDRDAFLYVSDFFEESEEDFDKVAVPVKERSRSPRAIDQDTGEPSDESNERFATAQTVAALVAKDQDEIEGLEENGGDVEGEDAGNDDGDAEGSAFADAADAADSTQVETHAAPRAAGAPSAHSQASDFSDDRRGRRRRRRKNRGGAGLPESKFAEGGPRQEAGPRPEPNGRSERGDRPERSDRQDRGPRGSAGGRHDTRGPRREEDEDSRWNRKPAAASPSHFEDEDPPQSVMIAKVSDPNRLPPSPRRGEFSSQVLPGESLAKYRRGKGSEGRQDFGDRKRTDRAPEPRGEADDSAAGGRYSTPRKSRHGSRPAGFLAPTDEPGGPSGGSEEPEFDLLVDGSFASLIAPPAPKAYLAMDAADGDGQAAEGDTPSAEAEAPAKKAPAKKAVRKTAAKAAKKAAAPRKRATKAVAAESGEASEPADAPSGEETPAKKPARKSAGRARSKAPEDTDAAGEATVDAPLFTGEIAETQSTETPVISHRRSDFEDDENDGQDIHGGEDVHGGEDLQGAEDTHGEAGESRETSSGADGHQRLSRRDRRRLRMIEKRDERRRDRPERPADAVAPDHGAEAKEAIEADAPPAISARPERPAASGRDARHDRDSRSSATRGDRGGRDSRSDRDGRPDRNGRSDRDGKSDAESRSDRFRGKNSQTTTLISEVLKEGQEVVVQIAKEPLGQKGARITSHIALPGRYVVYMPTVEHVGVSRKVGTDQERLRLRKILQSGREGMPGGFICRTAAEGRSEADIHADMQFLNTLWQEIKAKSDKKNPPALIHHDLDIVQRVLRDQLTEEFKTIWVDNEELYERILRFVQSFQPSLVSRVRLYTKPAPIFDTFNVTSELEKALKPKVWLKSGGYIVINQTEALVAIDVNTGKFVGKSNRLEDTIVKTNLEAVKEAVRQIRLRDLGGIIVVDFIDMDERRNRQKVMQALDEEMKEDRAPYKILQFNDFGLVAITRKRVKQSLERTLCQPCPYCEGSGYIKNVQTVIGEILTEAQKIAAAVEGEVSLRVNPEVGKVLKSHTTNYLEELEEILKAPVIVTSDPLLHQEKFDLA